MKTTVLLSIVLLMFCITTHMNAQTTQYPSISVGVNNQSTYTDIAQAYLGTIQKYIPLISESSIYNINLSARYPISNIFTIEGYFSSPITKKKEVRNNFPVTEKIYPNTQFRQTTFGINITFYFK